MWSDCGAMTIPSNPYKQKGLIGFITDPDLPVKGLSGYLLNGLMKAHQEKAYLVTTGYNRNMIHFPRDEK